MLAFCCRILEGLALPLTLGRIYLQGLIGDLLRAFLMAILKAEKTLIILHLVNWIATLDTSVQNIKL